MTPGISSAAACRRNENAGRDPFTMKRLLALVLSLGMLGILAAPAAAARPASDGLLNSVDINQTIGNGQFVGEFTADSASIVDGVLTVTGTLTGTATNLATGATTVVNQTISGAVTAAGTSARCDILLLDLGPLNLNVLGLVIDLSAVQLDIFAVPGAGNLLGNLLCAVAGLLDGPSPLGNVLNNLLGLINQLLG
jgi:hypothetical protein